MLPILGFEMGSFIDQELADSFMLASQGATRNPSVSGSPVLGLQAAHRCGLLSSRTWVLETELRSSYVWTVNEVRSLHGKSLLSAQPSSFSSMQMEQCWWTPDSASLGTVVENTCSDLWCLLSLCDIFRACPIGDVKAISCLSLLFIRDTAEWMPWFHFPKHP